MASLANCGEKIAVINLNCIKVYGDGSENCQVIKNEKPEKKEPEKKEPEKKEPEKEDPEKEDPEKEDPEKKEPEKKEPGKEEPEKKEPEKKEGEKNQGNEEPSDRILGSAFSTSGEYFAVCDDSKQLTIWRTGQQWQKLSSRQLQRRGTSLTFTRSEDSLLVADKSGDVYSFSVSDPQREGVLLLGHVSMLLDVTLCGEDKFLATCDRDEKIRVSVYPKAHNIHSFCLGHTDFVTRLCYIEKNDVLLSGSGDGTVRMWNYRDGAEIACVQCSENLSTNQQAGSNGSTNQDQGNITEEENMQRKSTSTAAVKCLVHCSKHNVIYVGFDQCSQILVYRMESCGGKLLLKFQQTLHLAALLWDITVDPQGRLWVLQTIEGATLQVYNWQGGYTQSAQLQAITDDPQPLKVVQEVNKDWQFFADCIDVESIFPYFRKLKIDNVKEYMQRKQLKQQQKKPASVVPPGEVSSTTVLGEPETKKAKIDST